jgi:hypothetical protein
MKRLRHSNAPGSVGPLEKITSQSFKGRCRHKTAARSSPVGRMFGPRHISLLFRRGWESMTGARRVKMLSTLIESFIFSSESFGSQVNGWRARSHDKRSSRSYIGAFTGMQPRESPTDPHLKSADNDQETSFRRSRN